MGFCDIFQNWKFAQNPANLRVIHPLTVAYFVLRPTGQPLGEYALVSGVFGILVYPGQPALHARSRYAQNSGKLAFLCKKHSTLRAGDVKIGRARWAKYHMWHVIPSA